MYAKMVFDRKHLALFVLEHFLNKGVESCSTHSSTTTISHIHCYIYLYAC